MSILKYKYKAHKLINTLFYVVVFVIGFVLGFGAEKIDFNKLVNQVLMIDSAKAYTIINDVDESKLVEMFSTNEDFDITLHNNILCFYYSPNLICHAISDEALNNFSFTYHENDKYRLMLNSISSDKSYSFRLKYNKNDKSFSIDDTSTWSTPINVDYYTRYYKLYTGFIPSGYESNSYITSRKLLDFSLYDSIYDYNGIIIDEDYIYERFMENNNNDNTTDFDITTFPYIYCSIYDVSATDSSDPRLACNAVKEEMLNPSNLLFYKHSSTSNYYAATSGAIRDSATAENPNVVGFQYRIVSKTFTSKYPTSVMYTNNAHFYTNFSKSNVGYGSHIELPDDRFHNVLDFSRFDKLQFNENLFKDNPDFKEVCVPNNKKFGIISNEYNTDENITDETLNNRYYIDRDYIWFPNGVKGLSTFFYHNKSENNVKVIDKDDASYSMYGYWYWLNSKEEINKYFGELPTSAMLSEAGYTDKYKYYNYTMHPFLIRYIGYEDDYMFNVFWFKELGVNHIDSDLVDYPEDYCFYIKNKYDVVLLNTNEWGDLYTDITILGDKDITISTSKNESDVNNVGIFSVVNNFIYQIKGTIIFINTNIHNLFLAMPLIVRMFILSVLTVFIIKFIIDMIVR